MDQKTLSDPHTTSRMSAVLKLVLLATVTVLVSAQRWNNYGSFTDPIKTHIDKALRNANEKFGKGYHVNYHSLSSTSTTRGSDFYVNVLLMVTTCKKDRNKGFGHRDECVTQKSNTPFIDCLVCKQKDDEELIDCARKFDVKERTTVRQACTNYRHGQASVMAVGTGNNKQETGCLGCV